MTVKFTKKFKKQYKKLPQKIQKQFTERLRLFRYDRSLPELRIHELKGTMLGYWSMNVNGDIRALYRELEGEIYMFAFIGSHSQLY